MTDHELCDFMGLIVPKLRTERESDGAPVRIRFFPDPDAGKVTLVALPPEYEADRKRFDEVVVSLIDYRACPTWADIVDKFKGQVHSLINGRIEEPIT